METPIVNQSPTPVATKKRGEKKWLLWGLIGFTAILLITALVLFFQLKKPVTPPLPPKPTPQLPPVQQVVPENVCELSFTVAVSPSPSPSTSPSPSPSVSPSPSPSPSASPEPTACFDTCDNDAECKTDLRCLAVGGDKRCVNPSCTSETDCACPEAAASPSPSTTTVIVYASPSPTLVAQTKGGQPELPEAGITGPAVLGVAAGLLMILLALLF